MRNLHDKESAHEKEILIKFGLRQKIGEGITRFVYIGFSAGDFMSQ